MARAIEIRGQQAIAKAVNVTASDIDALSSDAFLFETSLFNASQYLLVLRWKVSDHSTNVPVEPSPYVTIQPVEVGPAGRINYLLCRFKFNLGLRP